jgi:DNA-binding response OmpR family regulator
VSCLPPCHAPEHRARQHGRQGRHNRDGAVDPNGLPSGDPPGDLTKPFAFEELLARLRAAARRKRDTTSPALLVADLTLDPLTRDVTRRGRAILLTATEFRLLECLMRCAGRVVPREVLVDAVWGPGSETESNTLEAFVRLLRKKVDGPFTNPLIQTVRGVGYAVRPGPAS